MAVAVAELQGFKDNRNRFIVKELAIVAHCINVNIVFKSPYHKNNLHSAVRKSNDWCERNYHKILWEEGGIDFSFRLVRTLLKPFSTVYTKGFEKKSFLCTFHTDVRELEESWNVPLNFKANACCLPQHASKCSMCALKNAQYYYKKKKKCS